MAAARLEPRVPIRGGYQVTANPITQDFLLKATRRFPDAFMWRNNRVRAKALGKDGHLRVIDAGIDGQADITGCFPITIAGRKVGIRCEIEIKAGRDKQNPNQISFEYAIRRAGGIYLLVRDADKGVQRLELLLREMESS